MGERFANVYVWTRGDGRLVCWCSQTGHASRLDADVASVGYRALHRDPHVARYLREAGVAFRICVRAKP